MENSNESINESINEEVEVKSLNLTSNKGLGGKFVKEYHGPWADWYLCTYEYGDGRMVACCGLGKSGSFPVIVDSFCEVKEAESYLSKQYPKGKITIWKGSYDRLYVMFPDSDFPNVFGMKRLEWKIKDGRKIPMFSDFDYVVYTYQLNEMVMIESWDKLNYTNNFGETFPSLKWTIEEMINSENFESNLKDTDLVDFIDEGIEHVPEDIVAGANIKMRKLLN